MSADGGEDLRGGSGHASPRSPASEPGAGEAFPTGPRLRALLPTLPGEEHLFVPGADLGGAAGRPLPRLAVRAGLQVRRALLAMAGRVLPVQLAVFDLAVASARSAALATVARLGVADHLADGPRAAAQLADAVDVDADALHRVLRALVLERVFALDRRGRFRLTAAGQRLRTDHPESMRAWVVYFHTRSNQAAWSELDDVVRTGQPAFPRRFGTSVWTWFDDHPGEGRLFASAMRRLTELDAPAIVAAFPWPREGIVCDLAGGQGTLLARVLEANPGLEGVLVERPLVLAEAGPLLIGRGLADRVALTPGDLFGGVVASADVYLLKNVLHDWDDDACVRILRTARAAMSPGSTLVVVELLQERNRPRYPTSLTDLQMMVVCDGGRERSAAELQALLRTAGLAPGAVHTTATGTGLVTATA